MSQNVLAVVGGLIAVGVVALILLAEFIFLHGLPFGFDDPKLAADSKEYVQTLSSGGLTFLIVLRLVALFMGASVAAILTKNHVLIVSTLVGVIYVGWGLFGPAIVTYPTWMMVGLPMYLVVTWLAGKLELKRRVKSTNAR